jgi:hypothetical protein
MAPSELCWPRVLLSLLVANCSNGPWSPYLLAATTRERLSSAGRGARQLHRPRSTASTTTRRSDQDQPAGSQSPLPCSSSSRATPPYSSPWWRPRIRVLYRHRGVESIAKVWRCHGRLLKLVAHILGDGG